MLYTRTTLGISRADLFLKGDVQACDGGTAVAPAGLVLVAIRAARR